MAKSEQLPRFEEARLSGAQYARNSIRARNSSHRFLAQTYLAHLEGKRHPRIFKRMIESCLGRVPTLPEQKRKFLLLLHAVLGKEENAALSALPQFSKMVSALEIIDHTYADVKPIPKVDELIDYIKDAGGIAGLYDLSRVGASGGADSSKSGKQKAPNLEPKDTPSDIALPLLGARVIKVGRGYRLRMTEWQQGEYQVVLRVGRNGFVEAIYDESAADEDAA